MPLGHPSPEVDEFTKTRPLLAAMMLERCELEPDIRVGLEHSGGKLMTVLMMRLEPGGGAVCRTMRFLTSESDAAIVERYLAMSAQFPKRPK